MLCLLFNNSEIEHLFYKYIIWDKINYFIEFGTPKIVKV